MKNVSVVSKKTTLSHLNPQVHIICLNKNYCTSNKFLLSGEIYDVLHKLLKSDEDNATGDVEVLCELFSGEQTSYRNATEKFREISENTPFCILWLTQIPFVACLLAQLDQGHGLIDRIIFTFPKCLRPSPEKTQQATALLNSSPIKSMIVIFIEIARLHCRATTYTFDEDAKELLSLLHHSFITEIKLAIEEGWTPSNSKKVDLVQTEYTICILLVRAQRPKNWSFVQPTPQKRFGS